MKMKIIIYNKTELKEYNNLSKIQIFFKKKLL